MTTLGSLCSGAGMLDLAVESILPVQHTWHAETDPAASQVLAAHWPNIPNHGDITTTDWATAQPVDVLAGGIPCQAFSNAGLRKGSDDARDLWPVRKTEPDGTPRRGALDAIRALRPTLFVLENVPGLMTWERGQAFAVILADLDGLGYTVAWTVVGACKVGACHHRHRLFLAATTASVDEHAGSPVARRAGSGWAPIQDVLFGDTETVRWPTAGLVRDGLVWGLEAETCGAGSMPALPTPTAGQRRGRSTSPEVAAARMESGRRNLEDAVALLPTPTAADGVSGPGPGHARNLRTTVAMLPTPRAPDARHGGPNQRGSSGDLALPSAVQPARFGVYEAAVCRQEQAFGQAAPDPTEPGRLGKPRLSALFAEWMVGLPQGWITNHVGRSDAIRIAGNGVVPQAAAYALSTLPTFTVAVEAFRAPAVTGAAV